MNSILAPSSGRMARTGFALVTGASSGIGMEIAREYARRGVPLILTARRLDRLETLAGELRAHTPVEVIAADLAQAEAPKKLVDEIARRGLGVRILVNNAGYGVAGRYLANDWSTHQAFLNVMIGAVSELTWRLLPQIRASGSGRILNVASVAGLVPGADGQTLYAPVKAYMVKMSESLHLEYQADGVHVTALCPGFTRSEFHDVTGTRSMMDKLPKLIWLQADAVARAGIMAAERGQVLSVPGAQYKAVYWLTKLLPESLLLAVMGRNSKKFRKT